MDSASAPVAALASVSEASITHHLVVRGVSITLDSMGTIRIDGTVLSDKPRHLDFIRWVIRNEGQCKQAILSTDERLDPTAFYVPGNHTVYTFASLARKLLRDSLRNTNARNEEIIESRHGKGYYIRPEWYVVPQIPDEAESDIRTYTLPGLCVKFLTDGRLLLNEQYISLTLQESKVFEILVESEGRICTWSHFATTLYGANSSTWPERKIIDVVTCRIRKKLASVTGTNLVKSVWGRGHQLIIPNTDPKSVVPAPESEDTKRVVTPNGKRITVKDLPEPAPDLRWVPSRKVIVVKLIQAGMLSIEQTLNYYKDMSRTEIEHWLNRFERLGLPGLKTIE